MTWRKAPPHLVSLFESVTDCDPRIEHRQMFGYPAAFTGGKLFAGLHQENFIIKLSEADRRRLSALGAQPFEPMPGRRMREYVVLPPSVLSDRTALQRWLLRSLAYVASSPKKPLRGVAGAARATSSRRPARSA